MNSTKSTIIASLEEALKKLKINKNIVLIESKEHGDYSTNLPLTLQKEIGKNAMVIADDIINNIDLKKYKQIAKVEKAAPGFINF